MQPFETTTHGLSRKPTTRQGFAARRLKQRDQDRSGPYGTMYVMPDQRSAHAGAVLDALAHLDEHVVAAEHRVVLGEAVRAAAILPAKALVAAEEPDGDWREEMRSSLRYTAALLTRIVLTARSLSAPSPAALLQLVDTERRSERPSWYEKDPLWGRIAYLLFLCGELAHVSDNVEADCIGSLWAAEACLEFLVALDREGDLGLGADTPKG